MESADFGSRPEGLDPSVFVHRYALIESNEIGADTRVWEFTHVVKGAVIGARCNISSHCFIEAGARIGSGVTIKTGVSIWDHVEVADNVFIGPSVVLTNDRAPRAFTKGFEPAKTRIAQGASLGAGAVLVGGIEVGKYAMVAAGAVVTKDVPDYGLVMGNPAALRAYVCQCGGTRFYPDSTVEICPSCGVGRPTI